MSLTNAPDPEVRAAVVRQDLQNVLHPIVQHKVLEAKQMVVTGAHGSTIYDADGTAYLDGMAGLWCVNIGYGRGELAEVAADQIQQLAYFPHTQMNVPAAGLAEKINTLLGGDYHIYFVNSGSEANEAGFKIARQYQKHEHPGEFRYKTVSRHYAYHGTTLATLDAGGMGDRKAKFEPYSGDFIHVAPPYCYRCPFGLSYPSCGLACVKNMESTIQGENPDTIAEVIVEPIMSGIGVAVPPDEYLKEVEAVCRRYGILLHVDEVINGFGRTGKMFAHQHYGVSPDIIAVAKGISSAYMPIAATAVKNNVFQSFYGEASENRQVFQVNTYGGHPVRRGRGAAQYRDPAGGETGRARGGDGRVSAGWAAHADAASGGGRGARQGFVAGGRTGEGPDHQAAGGRFGGQRGGRFLPRQRGDRRTRRGRVAVRAMSSCCRRRW